MATNLLENHAVKWCGNQPVLAVVLSDISTEIRWVLSHKQTKTVRAGLEYVDLPPEVKAYLHNYINDKMAQKMEIAGPA